MSVSEDVCSGQRATARVMGVVGPFGIMRLGLLVMLLAGLTATTPVTCVCVPSDHGDMSIHPIFPHTHPSDVRHASQDHHAHTDQPVWDFRDGEPVPELRAQLGSGAVSPFAAGASILMLLRPWSLRVEVIGAALVPAVLLPPSIARPPLLPPPRRVR